MTKLNKGGIQRMSTGMKKAGQAVNKWLNKHGTTLLTTVGIASCGMAVYEMYKATDEVNNIISDIKADIQSQEEPSAKTEALWEGTKKLAPAIAPTVIWFTFGAGCIAASHRADSKKIAALTSAYELSETYRRNYISKVKDKLGERKAKEIEDDFYQEQAQKNMPSGPNDANICQTGHGNQLYFDEGSSRFFRASPQWLEKCKIDISHEVFVNNYACVNDFYYILGIPACSLGNLAGWESTHDLDRDDLLDIRWDSRASTSDWGETFGFLTYYPKTRFKL